MGVLRISPEIHSDTEMLSIMFNFLQREHNALVCKPKRMGIYYDYEIEGDGIPVGSRQFGVVIRRIVKGVISITVE